MNVMQPRYLADGSYVEAFCGSKTMTLCVGGNELVKPQQASMYADELALVVKGLLDALVHMETCEYGKPSHFVLTAREALACAVALPDPDEAKE